MKNRKKKMLKKIIALIAKILAFCSIVAMFSFLVLQYLTTYQY